MTPTASAAQVRQWARDKGIRVGDRGRLAPQIHAAFAAAQEAGPQLVAEAARETKAVVDDQPKELDLMRLRVAARPRPGAVTTSRSVSARQS